jgi:hypothetical protein
MAGWAMAMTACIEKCILSVYIDALMLQENSLKILTARLLRGFGITLRAYPRKMAILSQKFTKT